MSGHGALVDDVWSQEQIANVYPNLVFLQFFYFSSQVVYLSVTLQKKDGLKWFSGMNDFRSSLKILKMSTFSRFFPKKYQ